MISTKDFVRFLLMKDLETLQTFPKTVNRAVIYVLKQEQGKNDQQIIRHVGQVFFHLWNACLRIEMFWVQENLVYF